MTPSTEREPLIELVTRMGARLDASPHLVRLGRLLDRTVLLEVDGEELYLGFERGRLTSVVPGPSRRTAWRFGVRTDREAFDAFLRPQPAPGFHDLFGLVKLGRARIDGDVPELVRNLAFFKGFLALGREADAPGAGLDDALAPEGIEQIVGRYVNLDVRGVRQRIYYETSSGPPDAPVVLCLHTAGADTRQWRHLLTDEALARDWPLVAFDMPRHGKSLPPDGYREDEYLLDTGTYMATVLAVIRALGLPDVVLAGCSMGGRIALQLAARRVPGIHAYVAVEASDFQDAWYDIDWFDRPDAHGGEMGAALVSANIAPQAPEAMREQTLWMFRQSGPGVFRGDLAFYTRDDSLVGRLRDIDTGRTPVHLLCGEYDLTCTPDDARRTAEAIPGATIEIMEGLGHFPMSEHPDAFRSHFVDALRRVAGTR